MLKYTLKEAFWILILAATSLPVLLLPARSQTSTSQVKREHSMHASGTFTVKLEGQTDPEADPQLGRRTIDKQFEGDLQAVSKGQMLSANTDTKGSAGYVAIEKVTGKLSGRSGSFVLQHSGTMTRGVPQLSVTVVPDSGTGELVGLTGTMQINISEGKHSYQFDYTLTPQS